MTHGIIPYADDGSGGDGEYRRQLRLVEMQRSGKRSSGVSNTE